MAESRFLLSRSALLHQYNQIAKAADLISYSAKTNYEVAAQLESLTNCFFSMHSMESIDKIHDKRRIWFIAQAWTEDEITNLISQKITKFIVDNETDLSTILEYLTKNQTKISLLLRMRLRENTIHTGKYFVFGMRAEQINALIPKLKQNENIAQLGIHFHRKTQNVSEWLIKDELEQSLSPETVSSISILCIGGGLPVRYKNFTAPVIENIFTKIKGLREWLNNTDIQLMIEPGRFLAAPAIKLETEIKSIYDDNVIVNCSIYNSAMDTFIASIKLEVEGELQAGTPYTIKGHTPCSMDIFRYRVFLNNPKKGDKIVFLNAGAYNFASDFCSLKKLKTLVVD
jgi:ornithine decarboxylase